MGFNDFWLRIGNNNRQIVSIPDDTEITALQATIASLQAQVSAIDNPTYEYAEMFFDQQDIHPNDGGGVATFVSAGQFSSNTVEGDWSISNNVAKYAGKPKVINVDVNLRAQDTGASNFWARPVIRVTESVSGKIFWFGDLAMQDSTAYDGSVYISGSFKHLDPPANATYTFEYFNEENRTATLIPDVGSSVVLEAITL